MSTLYAASLGNGAGLQALSGPGFDFGTGSFTLGALIMSTGGGVVVARKGPDASATGGFELGVLTDGTVTFTTYDASTWVAVETAPTSVLDGGCHSIVGIRDGPKLYIVVDGVTVPVDGGGTGTSPVDVDNDLPLTVGFSARDPSSTQFDGMIMNVSVWNVALSGDALTRAAFARVDQSAPGLQGYWTLDRDSTDRSPNDNPLNMVGPVRFAPCISCVWTAAPNDYAFCCLANSPVSSQLDELRAAPPLTMVRTVDVPAGAPALFGSIMTGHVGR